jgi:hypothetical protein
VFQVVAAAVATAKLLYEVGEVHFHDEEAPLGRPKKKPSEWTTDEAIHRLFPKRVVTRLKKAADEAKKSTEKPISKPDSS